MAFFRSFLIENNEKPDTTFAEQDEAALVLFLLQARLKGSAVDLHIPADFEAPQQLPVEFAGPHPQQELKFVAGFLCFFVAKPMQYMRELKAFKQYFIPGFALDAPKQIQLAQGLREEFFTGTLNDLRVATTVDRFSDIAVVPVPVEV
jgi:hypothetical protein